MGVGVEEAVFEDHPRHDPQRTLGDPLGARAVRHGVEQLLTVDERERDRLARRGLPVHRREHDHIGHIGEVLREALGVVGFLGVVELGRDRALELVDQLDRRVKPNLYLDDAEQVLELKASAGGYSDLDSRYERIPVGQFMIGLIAQERLPT